MADMTVGGLKTALEAFPDDTIVVMAKDGEGNGFSPLYEGTLERYEAESTWSGEVLYTNDQDDDVDGSESEDGVPAVILWPTN